MPGKSFVILLTDLLIMEVNIEDLKSNCPIPIG